MNSLTILTQISFSSKKHWGYPDAWIEKWRKVLTLTPEYIGQNAVYKLVKDGQIIGFCAVERHSGYFEIGHLWLLPIYIGQGMGRQLLAQTLQAVVSPGDIIRVEADPNAESFYVRQGFVRIGRVESYPSGRWLPLLEKRYLEGDQRH